MTDEEEYENYLKIKKKIVDLLMDEVRNDTIPICNCFTLANDLLITFLVASAKGGHIKGKNKAEIADNARSLLTNAYKNAVKFFEELFFGEDDE
jgi:hypothetical protein